MKLEHKVFQGIPQELEKLLKEGWYIEKVLCSNIIPNTYYKDNSKEPVVDLVVWLNREQNEKRK